MRLWVKYRLIPRLLGAEVVKIGQIFLEVNRAVAVNHTCELEVDAVHVDELHHPLGLHKRRDEPSVVRDLVREEHFSDFTCLNQEGLERLQSLQDQ